MLLDCSVLAEAEGFISKISMLWLTEKITVLSIFIYKYVSARLA